MEAINGNLGEQDEEITLEAEIMPSVPLTNKKRKKYQGKLRLLGTVHAELAPATNKQRMLEHEAWGVPYSEESNDKREYLYLYWFGINHATYPTLPGGRKCF